MAKLPRYLFPNDYMADPSANVFNGRLYVYPSHDWDAGECFDDDGGHFQMRDYHVLSWNDVENDEATDHGVILDVDQVPWAEKQMWDNDVVEKDGKYYLIFSAKGYDGVFHLGVAIADKPEGPFIPQEAPIRGSFSIDPCMFKDDDGQIYCFFGGLWGGQLQWWRSLGQGFDAIPGKYGDDNGLIDLGPAPDHKTQLFAKPDAPALSSAVVRMSDDVLQFAEAPRPVLVVDKDGKPLCYAIGDSPYGPFTYQGVILEPVVGWTTHHSIVEYKGQWYLFYHDCVPSNDVTHLRSLKVQRLFYNEDGTIKPVVNE